MRSDASTPWAYRGCILKRAGPSGTLIAESSLMHSRRVLSFYCIAGSDRVLTIPSNWKEARTLRVIFVFLFLLGKVLLADTDVTSREQFSRLMPGGLPD